MPDWELPSLALFLRTLALFAVLPLGFDALSILFRVFVAALVALCLAEVCAISYQPSVSCFLGNVLVGICIGLPCTLLFHAAEWFGETFDMLRGQTIGNVMDPFHPSVSVMSQLSATALWAFLLVSGLLVDLIEALVKSFAICPRAEILFSSSAVLGFKLLLLLTRMLSGMAAACLPFAFAFVALELAFGFLTKLLPGISFTSEAFQAKLWVGFAVLAMLAGSKLPISLPIFGAPALLPFLVP